MRRLLTSLTALALVAVLFTGCSEDDDNPIIPVADVVAPTILQAYSDDGAIGLTWTPSVSETQSNFAGYYIALVEVDETDTVYYTADAGNGAIIQDLNNNVLTNGVRYHIKVWAMDTDDNLSATYKSIIWSPAPRMTLDTNNETIKVYATTSSNSSGIDIYNDNGKAEVISQASDEFKARGDLYVYAENETSAAIEIRAAQNAQNNPGPKTYFSSTFADSPILVDNLSEYAMTSPPNIETYTRQLLSIGTAQSTTGQMYWGRLERGSDYYYFRMLVVRGDNGALVQGSGADRYVELEFSFQNTKNVQYAKKVK